MEIKEKLYTLLEKGEKVDYAIIIDGKPTIVEKFKAGGIGYGV
ncbi:hypothetical protein [Clostridium sp. SHJSY1]|nr:hypothetical protein [Clostridium sp. SHJSY1]